MTAAAIATVVLAGGVGAARMLRGLEALADHDGRPLAVSAIVNTGDDTTMHGLRICPDLDTITYTLAGAIDPERGWGLIGETWAALTALERYGAAAPAGSTAGATWFGLGDRDLATHLYRSARLSEGAGLTDITAEITAAWGVRTRLVPMTEQRFSTMCSTPDRGIIGFQEYFVKERHSIAIDGIVFDHEDAVLSVPARELLETAEAIVIAPSNPIVSIGPIRALPEVDDLLSRRRDRVTAVSPIVGGAALKGPADRMLAELGHEPSVVGVARLYAAIASTLVIDPVDSDHSAEIEALGMRCVITPTVMTDLDIARRLAADVIGACLD